jgi:hypothetical protein
VSDQARPGDWVQIHRVVLPPGERAPQVPPDTQAVPLEMRVKGFLLRAAGLGETARIRTVTGRELEGRLVGTWPAPGHDFGEPVPELMTVGGEVRARLAKGEGDPGRG